MNYEKSVERKIVGKSDELERRKALWREIITAYQQGGEGAIKSVLAKQSDAIIDEFNKLIGQLRKKL